MVESGAQLPADSVAGLVAVKGWCALEDGKADEALTLFDRALGIHDGNPLPKFGKAKTLHALGRTDEARTLAETTRPTADPRLQAEIDTFVAAL
jgi:Tfp pilus assembly protein PilF